MMNFFTIAPNDQSLVYLSQIFGFMSGVLPAQANPNFLIGTMFKTFNTIALVVGALVIVYTTIVGMLATAHEGEFMGKKWSGLWVPLRTVFGIATLYPMPSGYSILQIIMMWVIVQGVGAADTLWTTTLKYIAVAGSPTQGISLPTAGYSSSMTTLFSDLVCQAQALNTSYQGPDPTPGSNKKFYYCADKSSDPWCGNGNVWNPSSSGYTPQNNAGTIPANVTFPIGPQPLLNGAGDCGGLSYCNVTAACPMTRPITSTTPTTPAVTPSGGVSCPGCITSADFIKCAACQAENQAVATIIPTLGAIAQQVASTDSDYVSFVQPIDKLGNVAPQGNPSNTPQWIQNYCLAQGMSLQSCCIGAAPCQDASKFPAMYSDRSQDQGSYYSTSDNSVNAVYWPYQIQSYLNGSNFITSAVNYLVGTITAAVIQEQVALYNPSTLPSWIGRAQNLGWIYAGSFYWDISTAQAANYSSAMPDFAVNSGQTALPVQDMQYYRHNFTAAPTLVSAMQQGTSNSIGGVGVPGSAAAMTQAMSSSSSDLLNNFMNSLTGSTSGLGNPLASAQSFGRGLLIGAQVIYAVFLVVAVALSFANVSVFALGTGVSGLGTFVFMLFHTLLPMMMALVAIMFTFGGLLAVYVPLIPYVLFTMAALGWIIGTIEAMVAAPLVAIGILSPGGQHEILGSAESALKMIFAIALRPSLMVFGLIFGIIFVSVAVFFVNQTFAYIIKTIMGSPGMVESLFMIFAYTALIITVVNKCFSLIHLIPERVITWIGGQVVSYGEEAAAGEVKRGAEAGGAGAEAALGGGAKGFQTAAGSAVARGGKGRFGSPKGSNVGGGGA